MFIAKDAHLSRSIEIVDIHGVCAHYQRKVEWELTRFFELEFNDALPNVRLAAFELLGILIENNYGILVGTFIMVKTIIVEETLQPQLLVSFINLVDGERDPKNLNLALQLTQALVRIVTPTNLSEASEVGSSVLLWRLN